MVDLESIPSGVYALLGTAVGGWMTYYGARSHQRASRDADLRDAQRLRATEVAATARDWDTALGLLITMLNEHDDIPDVLYNPDQVDIHENYRRAAQTYQRAVEGVYLMFDDPKVLDAAVALRERLAATDKIVEHAALVAFLVNADSIQLIETYREQHGPALAEFERAARERLLDTGLVARRFRSLTNRRSGTK